MFKLNIINFLALVCPISFSLFASYPWFFSFHGIDVAHDNNILGEGIRIAVLDTPVKLSHPSLDDPLIKQKYCYDISKEMENIYEHGTAVTSVIAAKKNDNYPDFVGVAPKAKVATFGIPTKGCPNELLKKQALMKIKKFKPDIINISSNVIDLGLEGIVEILEGIVNENPNVVIVVAAGNDGSVLSPFDIPCMEPFRTSLRGLQYLTSHKLKKNFVLVGNLAKKDDIQFNDLYLLPNNSILRKLEDPDISYVGNYSFKKYNLSEKTGTIDTSMVVEIIQNYLLSAGYYGRTDYLSRFEALHIDRILDPLLKSSEDEILFLAGKYGEIPIDSYIKYKVTMDAIEQGFAKDEERINKIIALEKSQRDFNRSLKVEEIKRSYCREKMEKEIANIEFEKNEKFNKLSNLFEQGLPTNNRDLINLSVDFIPIQFSDDIVLAPSSTRAGALKDIFISAFGTKIPGASFELKQENPIYKITEHSGTSVAAPIVSGALALVSQACKVSAMEAKDRIFKEANKDPRDYNYIFGHGMLNINGIIMECLKNKKVQDSSILQ